MGGKKKPKPTKKKDAPGSTHLSRDVKKGATKMPINSDYGFKIGDTIDIAPGTSEHEVNEVEAFGSIIAATPLKHDHPKGTLVKVIKKLLEKALPEEAPLLMLLPTIQSVEVAAPQYTYAAPTTSYTQYAAPQTASYSYTQPAQQQAYTYAAPATTAYAQPQMGGYTSYAAPQQQFGTTGMVV